MKRVTIQTKITIDARDIDPDVLPTIAALPGVIAHRVTDGPRWVLNVDASKARPVLSAVEGIVAATLAGREDTGPVERPIHKDTGPAQDVPKPGQRKLPECVIPCKGRRPIVGDTVGLKGGKIGEVVRVYDSMVLGRHEPRLVVRVGKNVLNPWAREATVLIAASVL